MTHNKNCLNIYRLINFSYVLTGNDDPCKVVRIRNVKIKMFDGAVKTLCNVKHILDLRKNLISLGTLNYNGFSFKSEGGVIKVSKYVMIMMKGQRFYVFIDC